jgi:hypothetical protein
MTEAARFWSNGEAAADRCLPSLFFVISLQNKLHFSLKLDPLLKP